MSFIFQGYFIPAGGFPNSFFKGPLGLPLEQVIGFINTQVKHLGFVRLILLLRGVPAAPSPVSNNGINQFCDIAVTGDIRTKVKCAA
jgi:hypothetical protein